LEKLVQFIQLKIDGLQIFPSKLSATSQGALLVADNIVINREGVAESRRGFKQFGSAIRNNARALQLMQYAGKLLRHTSANCIEIEGVDGEFSVLGVAVVVSGNSNTLTLSGSGADLEVGMLVFGNNVQPETKVVAIAGNLITLDTAVISSFTNQSVTLFYPIEPHDNRKVRSFEQNGNIYINSKSGMFRINDGEIAKAGAPKATEMSANVTNLLPGFLSPNASVAYRLVWGIRDKKQNLLLGAPSSRTIARNFSTTNSGYVKIEIPLSSEIKEGMTYQLYRTGVISNTVSTQIVGSTSAGVSKITNVFDTDGLQSGLTLTGPGVPDNTQIVSIVPNTELTLSAAILSTNSNVQFTVTRILEQDPGDEMQLIYEDQVSAASIASRQIKIEDITSDVFRENSPFLYTNQISGEGILQQNEGPPTCLDCVTWQQYAFYANTKSLHSLAIDCLGVSDLVPNDTFVVKMANVLNTYTFGRVSQTFSGTPSSTTITVPSVNGIRVGASIRGSSFEDGTIITNIVGNTLTLSSALKSSLLNFTCETPFESGSTVGLSVHSSPGNALDETIRSLVRIINQNPTSVVNAFYLSNSSDIPGQFLLEAKTYSASSFFCGSSKSDDFNPTLPLVFESSTFENESTNNTSPNKLYYSKFQQPEAVPLLNFIEIGAKSRAILRILPLRDSLIVLKEDGIYRISGGVAPFNLSPIDYTIILKAPDSAVVLSNFIYALTNMGVVAISDSNVQVASRPIENEVTKILSNVDVGKSFGAAYENDRGYYLFVPNENGGSFCLKYNLFTNSWTRLYLNKTCALVNSATDRLYLGAPDSPLIEEERKSFSRFDFADREYETDLITNSFRNGYFSIGNKLPLKIGDVFVQKQYVTIQFFNQLLTLLDADIYLESDYYSTLRITTSSALYPAVLALRDKISIDSSRIGQLGASSASTYSNIVINDDGLSGTQDSLNSIITALRDDRGVAKSFFPLSSGFIDFESPISTIDNQLVKLAIELPLLSGPTTIYQSIETKLQWAPYGMGDVSISKMVPEASLILNDAVYTEIRMDFSTDLSGDLETQLLKGPGPCTFGQGRFGESVFGGSGTGVPLRTFVPRNKNRCRYINVGYRHSTALENVQVLGVTLKFTPISHKAYK
jgi:hypothetical protein